MKKLYALFIVLLAGFNSYGQWENLNTGLSDNLNVVVFFQTNAIASGQNGLNYTTTGGVGSSRCAELHDFSNAASEVFESTTFTSCAAVQNNNTSTGIVYACGQTNDLKAVIFRINIPAMTYSLVYIGAANTKFNKIACQDNTTNFTAVGDNGKIVSSNGTTVTEITSNTTENITTLAYATIATNSNTIGFGWGDRICKATISGNALTSITLGQNNAFVTDDLYYVYSAAPSLYSVGGNNVNNTLSNSSPFVTYYNSNFNLPLNANTVINSNVLYVGTDSGIYKFSSTNFTTGSIEWQPSSLNHKINKLSQQTGSTYIYACGDNGLMLRASNGGGATKPFVKMSVSGVCLGSPTQFTAVVGSGNSSKWFVNGQQLGTSLTSFSYTFPAIGQYTVSLEVKNSFNETTTISQPVTIYGIPQIDKPVAVSDLILCKEEATQIQIENSEQDVKYVLRKSTDSNSNYGESGAGNGGTIQFTTGLINQSGTYYLDAVNTISGCKKRFTGTITITVEKTKADFRSSLINAYVNEQVNYTQACSEAQNFDWQFTSASGTQTSALPNPVESYSSTGQVSVTLDASSANGCHDIITKNGPNVVNVPPSVDCMLLVNRDTDLPWPGYYRADIAGTSPVTGGFLSYGSYNNPVFDSKYGVTFSIPNKKGAYLTKHDSNGILKWIVYTVNEDTNDENNNYISSCVEDREGNIYISGKSEHKFYDTAGRVIDLYFTQVNTTAYFLIKLNSKGEFLWRLQNRYAGFNDLVVDNNNNLVAQIGCYCGFGYANIPLYIDGVLTQNIGNSVAATDSNLGLVKFTPNGTVLWDTEIKVTGTGSSSSKFKIQVDGSNNIYFAMGTLYQTYLYSASNTSVTALGNGDNNLIKYDSSGNLAWVVKGKTTGITGVGSSTFSSTVDSAGNSYLMGRNDCTPTGGTAYVFQNADGSTTQTTKGSYMLAKVNTNGVCEWIRSTTQRVIGNSMGGLLDNNELFVTGYFTSGTTNMISTGELESADGHNFALTMNRNNEFLAVYDLNGVLKRVVTSYEGNDNPFVAKFMYGMFKKGDYFYVSRNINNTVAGYTYYGNVFPAFTADNYDGTTVIFKESCGTIAYRNPFLSVEDGLETPMVKLYPNPTSGAFTIGLNQTYNLVEVEVYDFVGKRIKAEKFFNTDTINSNIEGSTGLYLLKIKCDGISKWIKLIKE